MADIKMPAPPLIPLFMDASCRDEISTIIRARDIEVACAVLEAVAEIADKYGNGAYLIAMEIRNLKVSHD